MMQKYLAPPNGDTPQDTKAKMQHWRKVVLNPEKYAAHSHTLSNKKDDNNSRQNILRLLKRQNDLAEQIMQEAE